MAGAGASAPSMTSVQVLEVRIEALERMLDERHAHYKEALEISAKEMARRLETLNGEAGRLREMQATYVPREVYDQSVLKIRVLEEGAAYQKGQGQIIAAIVSACVSIIIGLLTVIGVYLAKKV